MKPVLKLEDLVQEATEFANLKTAHEIDGKTDRQAVGNYFKHKFIDYLSERYFYRQGDSELEIDFPELEIAIEASNIMQQQSFCPFKSANQKVFGLGHHLLVFTYKKYEDPKSKTAGLEIERAVFIDKTRTADFSATKALIDILDREGNKDDIVAFILDRHLVTDEIGVNQLADMILAAPLKQGWFNALNIEDASF
jgi:hypothetical protein